MAKRKPNNIVYKTNPVAADYRVALCPKRGYATKQEAKRAYKQKYKSRSRNHRHAKHAYLCPQCERYHLTSESETARQSWEVRKQQTAQ